MVNNIEEELNEEDNDLSLGVPIVKLRKKTITIVILIVLLVGAIGYIVYDELKPINIEAEAEAFSMGAQYGYKASLLEIYNKAITCDPVQITNEGEIINLIDTKCLSR